MTAHYPASAKLQACPVPRGLTHPRQARTPRETPASIYCRHAPSVPELQPTDVKCTGTVLMHVCQAHSSAAKGQG